MPALRDPGALIALLDQDRTPHADARAWFEANALTGWASCPPTQYGCIRVMAQAGYPSALPVADVASRLRDAVAGLRREFWPDDVSSPDALAVDAMRIHGARQVTDVCLLALAVRHGEPFATFGGPVASHAVHGAGRRHLVVL